MIVVGLTGGIGAGKSTVARLMAARGADVIDVDAVGRSVLRRRDGAAYARVVSRFGAGVVGADGEIDRALLAAKVFGDEAALADLTAISHPAINAELARRLNRATSEVVVLDMAVLVESDLGRGLYKVVVVVEAPWPVRLERLLGRGLTEAEAAARRDAQATDAARRKIADHVLLNDDGLSPLAAAVDRMWPKLLTPGGTGRP
jgi:dephospho-CoA kinase